MTDSIKTHFDKMAVGRDENISRNVILNYEQNLRADAVLTRLDPGPDDYILEVDCGNGRDLVEIGKTGCRCVGIDISDDMLQGARQQLFSLGITNVEIKKADVTGLEYEDNTFDKLSVVKVWSIYRNLKRLSQK